MFVYLGRNLVLKRQSWILWYWNLNARNTLLFFFFVFLFYLFMEIYVEFVGIRLQVFLIKKTGLHHDKTDNFQTFIILLSF